MDLKQVKHLMRQVERDELYQEILRLRSIYEPEYERILQSLSPEEQHCLNMYIKVCQGAEARISRTAYFLTPIP